MSAVTSNPSYSGALSILSSSTDAPTKATDDTESASAKLIDIAKQSTSGQGTTTLTDPTDTISLSDAAQTYVKAAATAASAGNSNQPTNPGDSDQAELQNILAYNKDNLVAIAPQAPGLTAALKNGTVKIQPLSDIQGLDFQNHQTVTSTSESSYWTFNSQVRDAQTAANPNNLWVSDAQGNYYQMTW